MPQNTEKFSYGWNIFPRYKIERELRSMFPNISNYERFDLLELYRDVYDPLLYIRELCQKYKLNFKNKKEFISKMKTALNYFSKSDDFYVGTINNYSFKNRWFTITVIIIFNIVGDNNFIRFKYTIAPSIKNFNTKIFESS